MEIRKEADNFIIPVFFGFEGVLGPLEQRLNGMFSEEIRLRGVSFSSSLTVRSLYEEAYNLRDELTGDGSVLSEGILIPFKHLDFASFAKALVDRGATMKYPVRKEMSGGQRPSAEHQRSHEGAEVS